MKTKFDVLGIGNAIMDIIAPVPDQFLTANDMTKGTMALIDQPTALGINTALEAQSDTTEIAGGSAANTLVGISMLGVRAAYIGKVGQDAIGKRLTKGFREAGLTFDTAPSTTGKASARCMIAVTPDGQRTMNTFLGASTDFGQTDVARDMIEAAEVIYLEGYLFDSDDAKKAFARAAEMAKAAGRKVALTLSDPFCVDRHRASFRHLVENHVDILFANEAEALSLYETDRLDTALDALHKTKTVACVTRSEKGSIIQDAKRRYLIPAAPVDRVLDTTGAGDQRAILVVSLQQK